MAHKLNISDLSDIVVYLTEVTQPYQLGIQLRINVAKLDEIEKNYPKNIARQKTEVIKCWLRNSPDASWTTLASAVERMGGHTRLVGELKGMGGSEEQQGDLMELELTPSPVCLDKYQDHNVLLLGKMGHGKSTLGNIMLNNCSFTINNQRNPQTCNSSATLTSTTQCKSYKINVYDHDGLFEGTSSADSLSFNIPKALRLVLIILKRGCSFNAHERNILEVVTSKLQISRISALVLTHCERLSEEERREMIEQFKKDHPSVAELMGKGILAVGFPDNSLIKPGSNLSQRVKDDKEKLRYPFYSCDDRVTIQSHDANEDVDMASLS